METHFEGSRSSENHDMPHQRTQSELHSDTSHEKTDVPKMDSDVNTDFEQNAPVGGSLTNDESANTDPNKVADKPTFNRNESV